MSIEPSPHDKFFYEVILDRGETPNKCTIAPLAGRPEFRIWRVKSGAPLGPMSADWLLHPDGECLSDLRESLGVVRGLAAIDCTWRRLPMLVEQVEGTLPKLARIPSGFVTAYPRKSAHGRDPDAGLATIEAIFIARALLGAWVPELLSHYYFGTEFVRLNARRFADFGVREAQDPTLMPRLRPRVRSSEQRKADRRVE